jgi:hypothetical protein
LYQYFKVRKKLIGFIIASKYFTKLGSQFWSPQVAGHNFSIGINQQVQWNTFHIVQFGGCIIPPLQVAYMCPVQVIFPDSIDPVLQATTVIASPSPVNPFPYKFL